MNIDTAVIDQSPSDLTLPVALHKGSCNRKLPQRYLDILPCSAPKFPSQEPLIAWDLDAICCPVWVETPHILDSHTPVQSASSAPNIFGLMWKYHGNRFLDHDTEDHLTFKDLCNSCLTPTQPAHPMVSDNLSTQLQTFLPYPNESLFSLGHWYWNEGQQKTLSGFQKLIEIVGNSSFLPSNVCHTDWGQINLLLADPQAEKGENDAEWMDAANEGWNVMEVKISIPFHCGSREPGTKIYQAASLYHLSLIAVMRGQVADPHDFWYFHTEPYQLLWSSPLNRGQAIHVHGKLYTSESFLCTHIELQQSIGEPRCQLTWVICAFMFWSDETHLTSFGNTKLWLVYAFFGNESKYHHGKPSCNSCNHIAYLEKVRFTSLL